ncbi:aerotolerance-like protein [Bacteroidia bacterium]|nr:aerotolerance-like protein [Bacteroidia bacterium]
MKRLILIFLLTIPLLGVAQVTFKGSAVRAVVVGEQFRVNYTLNSSSDHGNSPRLPETSGMKILFGPTLSSRGSSTNIVNGNVSTSLTEVYTFVLMAEKEGEYTLPPATIKVGNSEYKSNELVIKVLPQDQSTVAANANAQATQQQAVQESGGGNVSNSDIFIRMHVSKSSVYENEGFLVTFKLYTAVDISGWESMKFPEFEGFIAQEIEQSPNQQANLENYQGRNYRTVVMKQYILYPQRSGKMTIGQGKYDAVVRQRIQSQRPRSIFDMFDTYSDVKKTLTSAASSVDVKSLPANKPESFNGAVGDYKLTSTISATNMKANEPVTIKLILSGNGNVKMLSNPEIIFPNDFETYDPKVDDSTKVSVNGVSGSKTIEYYAVPRYAGDFTIPSVQFSYFDLKSKTYKTLSTQEYKLHVTPGEGGSNGGTVIAGANKEDIRMVGSDIRHIKTSDFHFQKSDPFFGSLSYWLWYLIPVVLFVVLFIIYRKQVAENANVALVRTKKANKVASKRLKLANQHLKANAREPFYDEMLKAVWGYLSDKLTIPVANLTKDNVDAELVRYGVSETLIRDFMDILNTAEFARFAPAQSHGTMDELYQKTVNAINSMEKI